MEGRWARNTYKYFTDEVCAGQKDKYIFQPLSVYVDKTGTDKIEKNSLEPVMVVSSLLTGSAREDTSNWFCLGFIPNLHAVSSAQRRHQKGKADHKSMAIRDYHRVLAAILGPLAKIQREMPVMAHRRGRYFQNRKTYCPVSAILGDNLSQNTQSGRMANNGATSLRMGRRCLTTYEDSDSPGHVCVQVPSRLIRRLNMGALGCEYGRAPLLARGNSRGAWAAISISENRDRWVAFFSSIPTKSTKDKYNRARLL
jgi:hypothetical protein